MGRGAIVLFLMFLIALPLVDARIQESDYKNLILENLQTSNTFRTFSFEEKKDYVVVLKDIKDIKLDFVGTLNEQEIKVLKKDIKQVLSRNYGNLFPRNYKNLNGFEAKLNTADKEALLNSGFVKEIYENYEVELFLTQSVPLINADDVWQIQLNNENVTGTGQTICVIDTGINYMHPNLGNCEDPFSSKIEFNLNSDSAPDLEYQANIDIGGVPTSYNFYEWYIDINFLENISLFFIDLEIGVNDYIFLANDNGDFVSIQNNRTVQNMWSNYILNNETYVVVATLNEIESTSTFFNITYYINQSSNFECSKVLGGINTYYDTLEFHDTEGHGSHVADIAAGNGTVKGVAPGANLVSAVSFAEGSMRTNSLYVQEAIEWCVENKDKYNISIISMSLGGGQTSSYCTSDYLRSSIQDAVNNNISVIIATGNTGGDYSNNSAGIASPACVPEAIRVTSTTKSDEFSSFAFRHQNFDILTAPGSSINAANYLGGTTSKGGTSMSTPHVSGAVALIQQYRKLTNQALLNSTEIFNVLNSTGLSVYDSLTDKNYSRIDVFSAVESIDNNINIFATLNLSNYSITILDDVTIEWFVNESFTTVILNVKDSDNFSIYNSTNNSGEIVLNASNFSLSGTYNVSLYMEGELEGVDWNGTLQDFFSISKMTPMINLTLNNYTSNLTSFNNLTVNITTSVSPDGLYDLYINEEYNLSDSEINITYLFDELGIYNITVKHNETEFYNEIQETLFVNISDYFISQEITLSNSSVTINDNLIITWTSSGEVSNSWINITDRDFDVIFYLEESSGSLSLNSSNFTLSGVYNVTFYSENEYQNFTTNASFEVLKTNPVLDLKLNNDTNNLSNYENITVNITSSSNFEGEFDLIINNEINVSNTSINETIYLDDVGFYNITLSFNETEFYNFAQESLFVTVTFAVPVILSDLDFNLSILKNETLVFSPNVSDPLNRTLSFEWFVNETLNGTESNLTFNAPEFEVSNYNITLIAIANETRNSSISWNLTVNHVPPTIISYSPSILSPVIKQNKTIEFSHNSSNFYDSNLTYEWFVNDSLVVDENLSSFSLNTTNIGVGFYNVTLVVSNGNSTSSVTWNLSVVLNQAPLFIGPNIANQVLLIGDGKVVVNNLKTLFSDPDGDSLTFELVRVSGTNNNVFESIDSTGRFSIEGDLVGVRNYIIEASDGIATVDSNTFTIDVRPQTTAPAGGGGGGAAPAQTTAVSTTNNNSTSSQIVSQTSNIINTNENNFVFELKSNTPGVVISKRVIESAPVPLSNKVYMVLELTPNENRAAEIEFEVDKSWLLENNVSALNIALFRLVDDSWVELETEIVEELKNAFRYVSKTPGFSIFAIGESTKESEDAIVSESSNFGRYLFTVLSIIFSIGAILLTIVLIEKYAKKHAEKKVKEFSNNRDDVLEKVEFYKKEIETSLEKNDLNQAKNNYSELKEIYEYSLLLEHDERENLKKALFDYYEKITKK